MGKHIGRIIKLTTYLPFAVDTLPLPHVHLWSAKTKFHAICVRSFDQTTVRFSKPGVSYCAQLYGNLLCVTATTLMTNIKLIAVLKFYLHNTIYITVLNSNTPLLISVSLKSRNCQTNVILLFYIIKGLPKQTFHNSRTHYIPRNIILRCYLKRHLYFSHLAISLSCHIAINLNRKLIITTLEDPAIA